MYTLGVTLWAVGLVLVPWLTAGCSGIPLSLTHLVRGSCMGLDGYDVLSTGLTVLGWHGPFAVANAATVVVRIMEVLVIAGVVLIVLLWRRRRARALPVAVTVWMILVTLVFVVGWQGTTGSLGHTATLVYGAGASWVVGPGVWMSGAGMLLAGAGCATVWLPRRRSW